jgi:hypothetical protein
MKLSKAFFFSAALLLGSQTTQAAEPDRAAILAPVQAAYDFHQAEAVKVQNQMDAIEDDLRDPVLTTERKQTLTVVLASLRAKEAAALARFQAESTLARLKLLASNTNR